MMRGRLAGSRRIRLPRDRHRSQEPWPHIFLPQFRLKNCVNRGTLVDGHFEHLDEPHRIRKIIQPGDSELVDGIQLKRNIFFSPPRFLVIVTARTIGSHVSHQTDTPFGPFHEFIEYGYRYVNSPSLRKRVALDADY